MVFLQHPGSDRDVGKSGTPRERFEALKNAAGFSTHFWDAYPKGNLESKTWLQSDAPRKDCDLVVGDTWEWK